MDLERLHLHLMGVFILYVSVKYICIQHMHILK